ncbi:MAG: DNA repair protein RadC [Candidatus Omnitrophica bacterium]|nr:DNA repair protein RadC [Candidatus Omnitrophota bacterium]
MSSYPICQWPVDDRPREKLIKYGEKALTDSELLAIILRTGVKGRSALDLGRKIVETFGSFSNMYSANKTEWLSIKGVGSAKLAQIKAAIEIGRRFKEVKNDTEKIKIKSSAQIYEIIYPQLCHLNIEVFKIIFLDGQNHIVHISEDHSGTVNQVNPIIREIFKKAIEFYAVSIICAHNHPSGDPAPSPQDKAFTEKLKIAGNSLQVKVLDHIIVAGEKYFSFADQGMV